MRELIPITIHDLTERDITRFWSKVDKRGEDDCWEWRGGTTQDKQPRFSINSQHLFASRVSFCIAHGEIDDTLLVIRTCDNKRCINPNHLVQGDQALSHELTIARGRSLRGERSGTAILTRPQVEEVKQRLRNGESRQSIADAFGVHYHTIGDIARGETWQDVE